MCALTLNCPQYILYGTPRCSPCDLHTLFARINIRLCDINIPCHEIKRFSNKLHLCNITCLWKWPLGMCLQFDTLSTFALGVCANNLRIATKWKAFEIIQTISINCYLCPDGYMEREMFIPTTQRMTRHHHHHHLLAAVFVSQRTLYNGGTNSSAVQVLLYVPVRFLCII